MTQKKSTRGGYRKNARRPQKYGEETQAVSFKVPASKVQDFTERARQILNTYIKK